MSITVMKQALEALEESHPDAYRNVITSLRQAIADADRQEPMKLPLPCDIKVGHVTIRKGVALSVLVARMQVLYDMAQASPPQRQPLTREQAKTLMTATGYDTASPQERTDFLNGLRHAEAAHGIKGEA